MKTVREFISLGSKITADGNRSHESKTLAPWKKSYDQHKQHIKKQRHCFSAFWLRSSVKSRDIVLPTKVRLVKAMVFPVVMYGCDSWTIKKAELRRIDAFELWC